MLAEKDKILGYAVDTCGISECIKSILETIHTTDRCRWLACMNPHAYATAIGDPQYFDALKAADWLVPDGIGIVWASRLLKGRIRRRVTGSDVFWGVQEILNQLGAYRVFFLGSTNEVLAEIELRAARDFPNLCVAGTYSPPFREAFSSQESQAMVNAVNAAHPDVLWVGISAPKQEKWIFENQSKLNAKFAGAVGAVFDFYSGRVHRPHPLFQELGLEWLPRLLREPRRLCKRTLVSAPIFMRDVLCQRFALHKKN